MKMLSTEIENDYGKEPAGDEMEVFGSDDDSNANENNSHSDDSEESEGESDDEDFDNEETSGGGIKRKADEEDGNAAKSAKLSGKDSKGYKEPTASEIASIKETQMLYHSNLFRLQMDELNSNIEMKTKHKVEVEVWMKKFQEYIKKMKKSQQYSLDDYSWFMDKKIKCPFPAHVPKSEKGIFCFAPPTEISFIGSYASQCILRTNMTIDIMMTLDNSCMQGSDWQNGRWLKKRCLYLCWLALKLSKQTELVSQMEWTYQGEEELRPVLRVTPTGSFGQKWKFNLYPVPPKDYFKSSRFAPTKNCIRPSWFHQDDNSDPELAPTPHYNWLCNIDVLMAEHNRIVSEKIKNDPNISMGLKLLKTWLRQQLLNNGKDNYLTHLITMYVIFLIDTHKINTKMSGYQVFRTVILSLTQSDWVADDESNRDSYHDHYPVVFQFKEEFFNLAGNTSRYSYLKLKYQAKIALDLLNDPMAASFEGLFIKKKEFQLESDQILQIRLSGKVKKSVFEKIPDNENILVSRLGNYHSVVHEELLKTIEKGLGNRIQLLYVEPLLNRTWDLDNSPSSIPSRIIFGLILDLNFSQSLLTKGPSPDFAEESKKFREFWGEKCNLRRFQDGSFHEAVVWGESTDSLAKKRNICVNIVKYLLDQHHDVFQNKITLFGFNIYHVLTPKIHPCIFSTGEEDTAVAIQAFDLLSRKIRSLDLELGIASVNSTSEVIRHAQVFPPRPQFVEKPKGVKTAVPYATLSIDDKYVPHYASTIEVLVFLEISGKWPDDLKAIKAMKIEFYVKMAKQLRTDGLVVKCFPDHILIYTDGFIFKLMICYRREIYLHRLIPTSDGKDWEERDTEMSIRMQKQIEILPRLSTDLASIQSSHSSYGGTVRLCKRWLGSQLLSNHLPSITVELLVASLFKNPGSYSIPNTPVVGFLRFLNLLVQTDWKMNPLLLNLNQKFDVEDEVEILKRFQDRRETFPTMMIATPYEVQGNAIVSEASPADLDKRYKLLSHWSRKSPTPITLFRIKQIARAALEALKSNMFEEDYSILSVFKPSYEDFDIIINLDKNKISKWSQNIESRPKDNQPTPKYVFKTTIPVVSFDPVNIYLTQVKKLLNNIALVFYDSCGGDKIGIVWAPNSTAPTEFKLNHLQCHQIFGVKEKQQVPNIDAIIENLKILGKGLVSTVEIKPR